ncbi:methylmalonyl-CoA mutase [Caballeronia glebae]|uniref:Methylmalonyl-CoA mutase n=2 Tax=Caballeronia glebae TaxID=1777143 RepID=A0A158AU68_9BURK|nr:methylmalonyl-CoA mutase [Caballeronia glebae]
MGLCDVIDPWAGSYMMESLTAELAGRAREMIDEIEAGGGAREAIRTGWARQQIHASAAATQARIDTGEQMIVGINAFLAIEADDDASECVAVDGERVRVQQSRRIADIKRRRDEYRVNTTLAALTRAAHDDTGNLLALTIDCMRARATVGECTRALEAVWPRYVQTSGVTSNAYGTQCAEDEAWRASSAHVARLAKKLGRKPRLLMAKLGLDGHDRGANVVSAALKDAGFDVAMSGLFASPTRAARFAGEERCDVIGVSSLAGAHGSLVLQFMRELGETDVCAPVVVGGIVPDKDALYLRNLGVAEIFGPGTTVHEIVARLVRLIGTSRFGASARRVPERRRVLG